MSWGSASSSCPVTVRGGPGLDRRRFGSERMVAFLARPCRRGPFVIFRPFRCESGGVTVISALRVAAKTATSETTK